MKRITILFLFILLFFSSCAEVLNHELEMGTSTGSISGINWQWDASNRSLAITGSTSSATSFTISKINNVPADKVRTVTLDSGITIIGPYAFKGMNDLEKLTIPSTVTYVDNYAFDGLDIDHLTIQGSTSNWASGWNYGYKGKYAGPGS
jgi:hypothetical protein